MSRTLTFGDDGSNAADTCWGWINAQHWEGWDIDVVTAEDAIAPLPDANPELRPWESTHPRTPGDATGAQAVRHLTAQADPRVVLSRSTDLLAVGPRGPGLLKALHLGSTTDWLVQQPPAPLIIARSAAPVRRVLVAHDGSAHADRALDAFVSLPFAAECAVTVVVIADGRADVPTAVASATARLESVGVTPDVVTGAGRAVQGIAAAIEDLSPDLVVMGTRGHTGIPKLRVGSTTASLLRVAPGSVLIAGVEPG